MKKLLCAFLCLMFWSASSGADTGEAEKYISGISDKELIKLTATVYKTHLKDEEDRVAREIALERLIRVARRRHSSEIEKSGILRYKHEKISINNWSAKKLKKLYGALRKRHKGIDWDTLPYLVPRERAVLLERQITIETVSKLIMPKAAPQEAFRGSWWR